MNPYSRFTTLSNVMAAIITVGAVLAFSMPAFEAVSQIGDSTGPTLMAATGGALALLVVGWLAMTEAIFPLIFRIPTVRQMVLGKYFIEGTWLQAERGSDEKRMSVIDIQPDGKRFIFSGYSVNQDLEIQSNIMIEFSRFEWPFMVYKYRNSLSDGGDGRRDGVGEIQLEMNRASARRYNGFLQYVKSDERLKIEGAKLVNGAEVRQLRELDGRQLVFEKYWKLFFHRAMKPTGALSRPVEEMQVRELPKADMPNVPAAAPVAVAQPATPPVAPTVPTAPVTALRAQYGAPTVRPLTATPTRIERRRAGETRAVPGDDIVVPRRRATDWLREAEDLPIIRRNGQSAAGKTGTED